MKETVFPSRELLDLVIAAAACLLGTGSIQLQFSKSSKYKGRVLDEEGCKEEREKRSY